MIKKLMAIAVMIGIAYSGFGQSAKSVLDKVQHNLKSIQGATANFTYSTQDRNNRNLGTVSGTIALKGNKYYIKQGSNEIFCNGQKTWNFNGSDEVTVNNVDNSAGTLNPQKILSGTFVNSGFGAKLLSSAGANYVIELIPTDKRKNFTKVNLYVNKAKSLVTKAVIWEKTGSTVTFNMTHINTRASLPDSKFTFNTKAHPGVDVID